MPEMRPAWTLARGAFAALGLVCAAAAQEPAGPLTRSAEPASQSIPLLLAEPAPDGRVAAAILQWMATPDDATSATNSLTFQFLDAATPESAEIMRSYMWLPCLASAIAWQQPWRNAYWAVREPAPLDGPDNNLALGIGLIATASHTLFPQDTAVIGTINPDNSIGAVTHLDRRLRAAAKSGIKRVVVPAVQRIYQGGTNSWVSVEEQAAKIGIECLLADTFEEATALVLGRDLPKPPKPAGPLRHGPDVFRFLNERCQRVQRTLESELNMWRRRVQLSKLDAVEAGLLEQAVHLHEAGISAYHAGQPYYAREVLLQGRAKLAAISGWQASGQNFDLGSQNEQAQLLRKAIADRMGMRPAFDRDQLVSSLVIAEQLDWLGRLQARIEGAQVLAKQALAPNSDATEGHRSVARARLVTAIHETRLLLQDQEADFFSSLAGVLTENPGQPEPGQPRFWGSALVPTCLGAGEVLFRGLKDNADRFKETFVFDERLASAARLLRDTKLWWEAQQEWNQRQVMNRESASGRLGFTPGFGYQEDGAGARSMPPPDRNLGATADCFSWVNTLCEVESLRAKYLVMDGAFDPGSARWLLRSDALLERMIQAADAGAQRGIGFAERVDVSTAVLQLVRERADGMRHRPDADDRIEALRQYWRCSLLGSLCWQLMLPEPEPAIPAPATDAEATPVRRALPASDASTPPAEPAQPTNAIPALPQEPSPTTNGRRFPLPGRRTGTVQPPRALPIAPSTDQPAPPTEAPIDAPRAIPVNPTDEQATMPPVPIPPSSETMPALPPGVAPLPPLPPDATQPPGADTPAEAPRAEPVAPQVPAPQN